MNKDTWMKDLEALEPGTIVVYNEDVKLPVDRDDCVLLGMPMTKMARKINPKLGRLIANMYYVGAVAHLVGIDEDAIEKAVKAQFKGKEKAVELNMLAISEGRSRLRFWQAISEMHSPQWTGVPISGWSSIRIVESPCRAHCKAAFPPPGPAPTTRTSHMVPASSTDYR